MLIVLYCNWQVEAQDQIFAKRAGAACRMGVLARRAKMWF